MLQARTRSTLGVLAIAALAACGEDDDATAQARDRYEIPGPDVFPEGIGSTPDGNAFFVGSTVTGAIYRAGLSDAAAQVFLEGGADGRTDVRGIKVAPNGRLFAAGGTLGRVFIYDSGSRALVASLATGAAAGGSFVNDLAIAPSGDVFATDSRDPVIYRIANGVAAQQPGLERWRELEGTGIVFQPAPAFNLNGIVATADGRFLLTVHSATGQLFRIGVADKAVTQVSLPGGATLPNGDGLLLDGRTLWAMTRAPQTNVGSVVKLQLSENFDSATVESTTTDPTLDFPTTIARAGGRLLVVNSQLNRRPSTPPALPFTVSGIPVP
jgi:Cu-Zn family superoxide dismutase